MDGEHRQVRMSLSGMKRETGRNDRPSRDDAVVVQYQDTHAVSGYVAGYDGWGPSARYYRSRRYVVDEALQACSGGELLDAGCGPGMLVSHLLHTRPNDFTITACDQSAAMIDAVAERVGGSEQVRLSIARIEDMPFASESFDVVLATGVLEYADAGAALRECARVVRPGGLVVVTMLNPQSPYRLFEWCLYWPLRRLLGRVERALGVPPQRRHGARTTGIRAVGAAWLRRMMQEAGLAAEDTVFYDITPLVPPVDKVARRWAQRWRHRPETTVSRGALRCLGTAYLVTGRRTS
jgi:ubiquinone/menaquinone biosynthesis C-methylase UbiE